MVLVARFSQSGSQASFSISHDAKNFGALGAGFPSALRSRTRIRSGMSWSLNPNTSAACWMFKRAGSRTRLRRGLRSIVSCFSVECLSNKKCGRNPASVSETPDFFGDSGGISGRIIAERSTQRRLGLGECDNQLFDRVGKLSGRMVGQRQIVVEEFEQSVH